MIRNVEKNLPQKIWKDYYLEKIMKVSKTTLFSWHFLNKGMFHGVLLQTVTMLSYSIGQEIVLTSSVSNARKNIVWIASQRHTRTSHAKNFRIIVIQICSTKPLSSLWRGLSSSSAPSAQFGLKRFMAVTTWVAYAVLNSAICAVDTIKGAIVTTEDTVCDMNSPHI